MKKEEEKKEKKLEKKKEKQWNEEKRSRIIPFLEVDQVLGIM